MNLFEMRKLPEEERADVVKSLAGRFNAKYSFGLDDTKEFKSFCSYFNLYKVPDVHCCNYFWGKMEDCEYCFYEYYYHRRHRPNDDSRWRSGLTLRLKKDSPDFHLVPRTIALNESLSDLLFYGFWLIISVVLVFCLDTGLDPKLKLMNRFFFVSLFFAVIFLFCAVFALFKYIRIKQPNKFGLSNQDFIRDYVILSSGNYNAIREVFTEEVCSKIVKYDAFVDIEVEDNCITTYFEKGEKLSYNACRKYLKTAIRHASLLN